MTTKDKIFLLSIEEAKLYFKSDEERRCENTAYSKYKCYGEDGNWWLRTKDTTEFGSYKSADVAVVYWHGAIGGGESGYLEQFSFIACGVRPAMWIDLSKID